MKNFEKIMKSVDPVYWAILALFVLTFVGFLYGNSKLSNQISELRQQNIEQSNEIAYLKGDFASTTSLLSQNIEDTESALASALEVEKKKLEDKFGNVQNQVGAISGKVGTISGTVNTLEKLSKTDPELLQKYSKVFFLNEHYEPPRLSLIESKYRYFDSRQMEVHQSVKPYLENLLDKAKQDGQEIYVFSAYRSFSRQQELKGQYTVTYGEGANKFSADQGYSEHQLGTTVDLITTGIGGTLDGFGETEEHQWLINNAHKYGFILSYPQNNQFYIYEPWHWRFVGVSLATHLYNSSQNFYDLDQRKLDEYLVSIFD